MKRVLYLLVIVLLVSCVDKKQNQQKREIRTDIPKELETRFFDSHEKLYEYLYAPIDSVNRKNLPERWFILPEHCQGNVQLERLVDVYNAFAVVFELRNIVEECSRFLIEQNEKIEHIDCGVVKNESIVVLLEDVKAKALTFSNDYENQEKEEAFFDAFWEVGEAITVEFNFKTFTDLTEEEYFERMNYANFVPEVDSLSGFVCSGDSAYLMDRLWSIAECENIMAKSIHAQLYLYADANAGNEFLPVLEYLMEQKEANPLASLIWRYWRCRYQPMMGGLSRDSEIYNDYYNARRLECAKALFNHIEQNPEDGIMINEFLQLATTIDIYRYGEFAFGNQSATEEHALLPMCGMEDEEEE